MMDFRDMSIAEAEAIGSAWWREEYAEADYDAAVGAGRAALCRITTGFWKAAEECAGEPARYTPTSILHRDLTLYYRLCNKLAEANTTDPFVLIYKDALACLAEDGIIDDARRFLEKLLLVVTKSLRKAHDSIETSERTITRITEALISERAALGEWSTDDERKDYAYARELVYSTTCQHSQRLMPDDELAVRIDAVVA